MGFKIYVILTPPERSRTASSVPLKPPRGPITVYAGCDDPKSWIQDQLWIKSWINDPIFCAAHQLHCSLQFGRLHFSHAFRVRFSSSGGSIEGFLLVSDPTYTLVGPLGGFRGAEDAVRDVPRGVSVSDKSSSSARPSHLRKGWWRQTRKKNYIRFSRDWHLSA